MSKNKRIVVFGATSAIAQDVARIFVAEGASLYCIGRNPQKLKILLDDLNIRSGNEQKINGDVADLCNISEHERLFKDAQKTLGGIDIVFLAHGSLPDQKECENSVNKTLNEIQINAISFISILTIAAKILEDQGSGVIAAISSVAGERGRKSNYVYGASKGMVSIFMQGLRHRLANSGVNVVTIKPGLVDTPMTDSIDKSGKLWSTPEIVAKGIVKAINGRKNEVYIPGYWRIIMSIVRNTPNFIFNRTNI